MTSPRISLCKSQTGTTQTAGARNKGGKFIGQLCISVVPQCNETSAVKSTCSVLHYIYKLQKHLHLFNWRKQFTNYFCIYIHVTIKTKRQIRGSKQLANMMNIRVRLHVFVLYFD